MSDIELNNEQKELIVSKIKTYFTAEFEQDIGSFEAEFLIDFFAKEIGPHFYNKALIDAQVVYNEKTEELGYLIQELEKPVT
jgi:uncharacterized protein (DUF2164 family)